MSEPVHPSQGLLASYATGELSADQAETVKAHMVACETCQAAVSAFEEEEGRRLSSMSGDPLSPGALQQALDRIEADSAKSGDDE